MGFSYTGDRFEGHSNNSIQVLYSRHRSVPTQTTESVTDVLTLVEHNYEQYNSPYRWVM